MDAVSGLETRIPRFWANRPLPGSNPDWGLRIGTDKSALRRFHQIDAHVSTNEVVPAGQPVGQAFMDHVHLRAGRMSRAVIGNPRFSSSTPGYDPVGDRYSYLGTWTGRGEAVPAGRGKFSSPASASSDRRGATMPRASTSAFTLDNSVSLSLRISSPTSQEAIDLHLKLLPEVSQQRAAECLSDGCPQHELLSRGFRL